MPVARTSFLSSELSRNAPQVFDAAEEHPVEVTRRDGEDMVLMTRREADARGQLLQLAAQLIAVATDDRGTLGDRMAERFPWMFALSVEERETCAKDLLESARASFATGEAHLAAAQMIAWEETATALAAGLDAVPVTWLPEPVTVERP